MNEKFDNDLWAIQESRNLARRGRCAADRFADYSEEQVDRILQNMVREAEEHAVELAKLAVEDTGFGRVEDKAYKNHMASTLVYQSIKDMRCAGIIREDPENKIMEVADPVGLILGIVPSTHPTSTVIYKSVIALKARNAIIFSPHPTALRSTQAAADLMRKAAEAAGAPEHMIGCHGNPTLEATEELMHCKEVAMIIATGGAGMVKAAYSSGKPTLGVGPGNAPAYIERTADIHRAVMDIIASKTFDNGTICASEQSVICEVCNREQVMAEFRKQGGYFMSPEETRQVCALLFKNGHTMNTKFVGRSPQVIAAAAGIRIPDGTRVLLGEQDGVGEEYPLSYEKLTTVLGFYTVRDWREACELSIRLLQNGPGHTLNIHTEDSRIVREFSRKPASRILVNTGGSQGATGISTALAPALTLGCGTWSGSSTSENVTPLHLINIKRVAYGLRDVATLVQADPTFHAASVCCRGVRNDGMRPFTSPAEKQAPAGLAGGSNGLNCAQLEELIRTLAKTLEQ